MRLWIAALALAVLPAHAGPAGDSIDGAWQQGSEDCARDPGPPIEVFQFDPATYVLRQSKCVHFEAPFIYVLFGEHTVFVQDTGATADPARFPLYDTVRDLVDRREGPSPAQRLRVLVTHSHSHHDHTAADAQFRGQPGVTLIEPNAAAVREHFGFADWPRGVATIDLGARELVVLPAPGHQAESIAVYDARTGWLLTGDSLYPGELVIEDWSAYESSMRRLAEFSATRRISAVMGTHIEMSDSLPLAVDDLLRLAEGLRQAAAPQRIAMEKFNVNPLGLIERVLGAVLKWLR